MFKNPTAEELYRMILAKKVSYEEIRRIDPNRFADLELTMRMLYDHSSIGAETKGMLGQKLMATEIPSTNPSMREPQRVSTSQRGRKAQEASQPVAPPRRGRGRGGGA